MASRSIYSWMTLAMVSLAIFFVLVWPASGAVVSRIQRDTVPVSADKSVDSVCMESTPCGWAVYTPFTRRIDYFMKNACSCPPDEQCVRSSDDLSVSAYVYLCIHEKTNNINSTS